MSKTLFAIDDGCSLTKITPFSYHAPCIPTATACTWKWIATTWRCHGEGTRGMNGIWSSIIFNGESLKNG